MGQSYGIFSQNSSIYWMKMRIIFDVLFTFKCPYYFLSEENSSNCKAELGGVMATLVPADKKIIHGMSEAIIVPCIQEP